MMMKDRFGWLECSVFSLLCSGLLATPLNLHAAESATGNAKGVNAQAASKEKMTNVLACRLANYQKYQDAAWTHLSSIGFKYVFVNVPLPEEVDVLKERLDQHGLKVVVVRGSTDLSRPSCVDELAVQLNTCQRLGVRTMFLSPKHPEVSKKIACVVLGRSQNATM